MAYTLLTSDMGIPAEFMPASSTGAPTIGSAPSPGGIEGFMKSAGPAFAIAGAVTSVIGAYYSTKAAKAQYEAQASALAFQADMAHINQRRAEFQAYTIMEAGARQIGRVTMQAGQIKGAASASMAARGISLGEGSAAEVIATTDLMKEIDAMTINTNRIKAAGEARLQATNFGTQASMLSVSSSNALATAGTISPVSNAFTSMLTSASSLSSSWYQNRRLDAIASALGAQP